MAWDLTVVNTLVESYVTVCANPGGAAASCDQEVVKICILSNSYIFQSLASETLGPTSNSGISFLSELAHGIRFRRLAQNYVSFPTTLSAGLALQFGGIQQYLLGSY